MKKLSKFRYSVVPGESITVAITPSVNLGRLYTANLDEVPQPEPQDGVYRFTAAPPVGHTHFLIIFFQFTGAPDGSQYSLSVDGSGAGNEGPFSVTVRKGDPTLDKTFQFEVIAA